MAGTDLPNVHLGRKCTKCGGVKPQSEYYSCSQSKQCKECHREAGRLYTRANAEKNRARVLAWQKANPVAARERKRKWENENRQRIAEQRRAYRTANREAIKEKRRREYHDNREAAIEATKQWQKANPDKITEYARRRRAGGRIPLEEYRKWFAAQEMVCFYCKIPCPSDFHVDHYYPIARGGKHETTNLRIACVPCNRFKGVKDPLDFLRGLEAGSKDDE